MGSAGMDVVEIMRSYVGRMLREVKGMKVLLLDAETTDMVACAYSQSEVLEQEVYLVQRLDDDSKEPMPHLKAVCFLRPTRENIVRLCRQLREPRFAEFHLYFSNRVDDLRMQELAEADAQERVASLQEAFGDWVPLDSSLFWIPVSRPWAGLCRWGVDWSASSALVDRSAQGLAALALGLRRRFAVRYQRGSTACAKLGGALHALFQQDPELYDFGARGAGQATPLMLLLDRRCDPVTPLLTQWTYQAMVHDVLGVRANRVDMGSPVDPRAAAPPGTIKPEERQLVLSARQDPFFAAHARAGFGELGAATQGLVQGASASSTQRAARLGPAASLDEVAALVDDLPALAHAQGVAHKHVHVLSALSAAVERRALMRVSEIEQEIVCGAHAPAAHRRAAQEAAQDAALEPADRLRVASLWALRYAGSGAEAQAALRELAREALAQAPEKLARGALALVALAGADCEARVSEVFSDASLGARWTVLARQTIRGVDNVYTRHAPVLAGMLEAAARGRLSDQDFPVADDGGGVRPAGGGLVVVFVVGGATYEEAKRVADLNAAAARGEGGVPQGTCVLLGGTSMQNADSMLRDWADAQEAERLAGRA